MKTTGRRLTASVHPDYREEVLRGLQAGTACCPIRLVHVPTLNGRRYANTKEYRKSVTRTQESRHVLEPRNARHGML